VLVVNIFRDSNQKKAGVDTSSSGAMTTVSAAATVPTATAEINTAMTPDLPGESYIRVLGRLHKELLPKTYLEIGTNSGSSLALATCASISVDPKFSLTSAASIVNKPLCALYQQTSDEFFASVDPTNIFGEPIDFAFLDGLHRCEFLLRDFMNTEKFCKRNSIIALHDCIPVESSITSRSPLGKAQAEHRNHWWTGDVWRTVWALKRYRPDLGILALDAQPTGLVLVSGLDPTSTILSDKYRSIVQEMMEEDLDKIGIDNWHKQIGLTSTHAITTSEQITARFWL
jgi:hypothetical protein